MLQKDLMFPQWRW